MDFIARKWGGSIFQHGLSTGSKIFTNWRLACRKQKMTFVHYRKIPYLARTGGWWDEWTDDRLGCHYEFHLRLCLSGRGRPSQIHHVAIQTHYHFPASSLIPWLAGRVYFNWQDDRVHKRAETGLSIPGVLITLLWEMQGSILRSKTYFIYTVTQVFI